MLNTLQEGHAKFAQIKQLTNAWIGIN
jgi:hypothetical protein